MLPILVSAALTASAPLVSHADALNEAYWSCMFSATRSARAHTVPFEQLGEVLDKACNTQREALKDTFVEIQRMQGMSPDDAVESWKDLDARGRISIERSYATPSN